MPQTMPQTHLVTSLSPSAALDWALVYTVQEHTYKPFLSHLTFLLTLLEARRSASPDTSRKPASERVGLQAPQAEHAPRTLAIRASTDDCAGTQNDSTPLMRLLTRTKEQPAPSCDDTVSYGEASKASPKPEALAVSSTSGGGSLPGAIPSPAPTALCEKKRHPPLKQRARPQLQIYRGVLAPFGKSSPLSGTSKSNSGGGGGCIDSPATAAAATTTCGGEQGRVCGVGAGEVILAAAEASMLVLDESPPAPLVSPAVTTGPVSSAASGDAAVQTGAAAGPRRAHRCRREEVAVPMGTAAAAPTPAPRMRLAPARDGLVMACAAAMVPHVYKVATGGEDACFVSGSARGALGVADGVSGWSEDGVDPGDYARTLVQHMREVVERSTVFDGRAALHHAQIATRKRGSATAIVAALTRRADHPGDGGITAPGSVQQQQQRRLEAPPRLLRGHTLALAVARGRRGIDDSSGGATAGAAAASSPYVLQIANMGDCGLKVVRKGRIVFETTPQQHAFNMPYQLSHPALHPDTDLSDSADVYSVGIEPGDVIIAASDGLWDNIWDTQLLRVLATTLKPTAGRRRRRGLGRASASPVASSDGGSRSSNNHPAINIPTVAAAAAAAMHSGGSSSLQRSSSAPQLAAADGDHSTSSRSGTAFAGQHGSATITPSELAGRAATALANAAHHNASDMSYWGPWSAAASRHAGVFERLLGGLRGGKMDDCTVVVGIVTEALEVAGGASAGASAGAAAAGASDTASTAADSTVGSCAA